MKNIVLIGFMGVGKTTTGQLISEKLSVAFFDTDKIIEQTTDMSVSELFEKLGEKEFRKYETEVVNLLSNAEGCVISCGGGIVLNKKNIDLLSKNGIIIYLKASIDTIVKRISSDKTRPIIAAMENPKKEIELLFNKRKNFYENNNFSLDVDSLTPDEISDKIINAVKDIL
ncbi:shikimate kinase [Candidatus Ruminimicrobium bovinum]|uniref:shikimate kinase n=1 Tax=Candidatus Ruminimicrobium bovinum TaxID=3242779 RepID=UPI0039B934BC